MRFIIYLKALDGGKKCKFCEEAKSLLFRLGYEYETRDLAEEDNHLFFDSQGFQTVPQIYVSREGAREHIGGFYDLRTWIEHHA